MKEITILSGKGGTGKTTITAALASIAEDAVFCDNDVDAADLHLILDPEILDTHSFESGWVAKINQEKCSACGQCQEHCRFEAIHINKEGQYEINPFQCEGCRLCERICPEEAITSTKNENNFWYISNTRFGQMVHAHMGPGEENSGKLVTKVRFEAKKTAQANNNQFVINDGPPGIGCAAISAITGTNQVLLVIEPTKSGLHDAQRLIELVRTFNIPIMAIVNKYDLNEDVSKMVEEYLTKENIQIAARIPFDESMVQSMVNGQSIIEYAPDSDISMQIKGVWELLSK